ncbi:replication protein [Enterobacteriaceae bacterium LUAb1]
MKELADKGFIAETTVQNAYFINPDDIVKGDRLSCVQSYTLTESKPAVRRTIK